MACPEGKTADMFESQFGTNHQAHFLLFYLLKDLLLSSSTPAFNSRVVVVLPAPTGKDEELKKVWKNPQQAADTTAWGAVAKGLEGRGGVFQNDCQIAGACVAQSNGQAGPGYAEWAYNPGENKLSEKTLELLNLT
ncbi:hypothetical protein PENSUB_5707 [Penicillium subrubescens]|uniref:Uncharacterized protein n=2 Tax=Penicillium subrubescens TaxID=1316194 RepID=A0A1Q5U793_9EURO|nr:hypothetical protein PENSUB_5707 [Penicillium subrubescens]